MQKINNLIFTKEYMFLKSISNFRGVAIIAIVTGHLYSYGFSNPGVMGSIIQNIITGGTALFVFISGFMFHYVFVSRYEYKKFMTNKVKNVGVPYFLLASLAIILLFLANSGYFKPLELMANPQEQYRDGILFSPHDSDLLITIKYYFTGRFLTAYWYIPFALILFSCAPLHMKFIKITLKYQLTIIIILSIISIFVHRPVNETNPLHSLVYYTPVYLIGIMFSMYSSQVKKYLNNKIPLLAIIVVLVSFLEVYLGHAGNYSKPFFDYNGVDLQYIQKIFLISLLYISLERWSFNNKLMNTISETSFAIFFIHPWVMILCNWVFNYIYPNLFSMKLNIPLYLGVIIFVLFSSVGIALITKKIFNGSKKTRYLIGY